MSLRILSLIASSLLFGVPGVASRDMMSAIPLHFEPNLGQTDARVSFTARGGGMSIYLTAKETVIARRSGEPVRMNLRGGRAARFEPLERLPGVSNYYRGNDPKKWREGVPHYARVRAKEVYDGVDVVYYGNARRLEYDFVVAPHGDASKIELAYEGTKSMRVDGDGTLVLETASGELRQHKPLVYQEVEGRRVEVAASYRIRGESVRFELARYDAEKPLVIDPILEYGTYLGGDSSADAATSVAADSTGIWLSGHTLSPDFPLASPADAGWSDYEGFVTKLNVAGTALVFSTFLGGSSSDVINAMAVDASGNAFITGNTASQDFPVSSALQAAYAGNGDAFATRLGPSGALTFATFLGGDRPDQCAAIVLTSTAFTVACTTSSSNFLGETTGSDRAILARIPLNGATVSSTKTLANAAAFQSLAADTSGAVYTVGTTLWARSVPATAGAFQVASGSPWSTDAFVAKLNAPGDQWVYVTHLGGDNGDYGAAIAVDSAGQAYVAGTTGSRNFPVRNAHQSSLDAGQICCGGADAFLTVLNSTGSALVFSTYFGGGGQEVGRHLALMPGGGVVIGGSATSADFPIVAGWRSEGGFDDAFFAKFTSGGVLSYSSYFGPTDFSTKLLAMAPGAAGAVYLAGSLYGPNQAGTVTPGAYDTTATNSYDAFLARFVDGPAPVQVTITSNPVGRQVIVDGRTITTPAVLPWQPGTSHSLNANAPQPGGQTVYSFANWAHGGAATQTVTAPAAATTYTVNYSAAPCAYTLTPNTYSATFEGISTSAQLNTQIGCGWTPRSSASWLTPDSPAYERTGSSILYFSVAANLGGPRSATITAGTATLTLMQAGSQGGFSAPTVAAPLHNQTIQTKGINFIWTAVSGAAGYEMRILQTPSNPNTGGTLVYLGRQAGANSTRTVIDMLDGTYIAYVRACGTGGFGDANCGAYAALPFSVSLLAPNEYPNVLSPVNNQILRSSTNIISWEPLAGATSYEVTLTNRQTGKTDLFINTATLGTVFTMSSTHYDLFVRGCQHQCRLGRFISFGVELPSLSQTPPTGLRAQIANGNTLNLSWNPVTGADLYRVQVVQANAGPGGGALTVAARQVSTTSVSMPVPAGVATVVLNACNGDGCGPPSSIAINPAGPNPSIPVVASPMPVVVADGPNVTISWSRIPGDNGSNTDYRLYVGDLSRDGPALDVVTKSNFYGAFLRAEGRRYDALVFATQKGQHCRGARLWIHGGWHQRDRLSDHRSHPQLDLQAGSVPAGVGTDPQRGALSILRRAARAIGAGADRHHPWTFH